MEHIMITLAMATVAALLAFTCETAEAAETGALVRVVDLAIGASSEVTLCNGEVATVRLLSIRETRDSVLNAVIHASAEVEVNGERGTVGAALYNLPQEVGGVQIDCTVTRGTVANSHMDFWGLEADARLRLWPAGSPDDPQHRDRHDELNDA